MCAHSDSGPDTPIGGATATMRPHFGSRLRLAFSVALACALVPFQSNAQLEYFCREDARRYDALLIHKRATTPEHVAEVYVDVFTSKGADREAQAVWRRMQRDGSSMERAIEAHLERYYKESAADERETLRSSIADQIQAMSTIRELVFAFERAAITAEFTAEAMVASWRSYAWDAPRPSDYYKAMIESKAETYSNAGIGEDEASVRAAVETRAALERDRGVPLGSIIDKGHACYKEQLNQMEVWLRQAALARAMGPLTDAEAAALPENSRHDPATLSRLTYYTHMRFGPRDYSLDRFEAWRIAAQ